MFAYWLIVPLSLVGQTIAGKEIESCTCENPKPSTNKTTATLGELCGTAFIKIRGNNNTSGPPPTQRVTFLLSSLGPVISKEDIAGKPNFIAVIGSGAITDTTQDIPLNDQSITFPTECGNYFFIAVLRVVDASGESFSYKSFLIHRFCLDESSYDFELGLRKIYSGNAPEITAINGQNLKVAGLKVVVENIGRVKLAARTLLDSLEVIPLYFCTSTYTYSIMTNESTQEFSENQLLLILNDLKIESGQPLELLENEFVDMTTQKGKELNPGSSLELDLSKIRFPESGFLCHETSFLVLYLGRNIADANTTNDKIIIQLNYPSNYYFFTEVKPKCELVPDYSDDGLKAVILREQFAQPVQINGQTKGFKMLDPSVADQLKKLKFCEAAKVKQLSTLKLCPKTPIDDSLSQALNNSLINKISKYIYNMTYNLNTITAQGEMATNDLTKIKLMLGLYTEFLKGFLDLNNDRFRQFILKLTFLSEKMHLFKFLLPGSYAWPSKNPGSHNFGNDEDSWVLKPPRSWFPNGIPGSKDDSNRNYFPGGFGINNGVFGMGENNENKKSNVNDFSGRSDLLRNVYSGSNVNSFPDLSILPSSDGVKKPELIQNNNNVNWQNHGYNEGNNDSRSEVHENNQNANKNSNVNNRNMNGNDIGNIDYNDHTRNNNVDYGNGINGNNNKRRRKRFAKHEQPRENKNETHFETVHEDRNYVPDKMLKLVKPPMVAKALNSDSESILTMNDSFFHDLDVGNTDRRYPDYPFNILRNIPNLLKQFFKTIGNKISGWFSSDYTSLPQGNKNPENLEMKSGGHGNHQRKHKKGHHRLSDEDKALLTIGIQLYMDIKMGKSADEITKQFDFLPRPFVEFATQVSASFKNGTSIMFLNPWIVYIMQNMNNQTISSAFVEMITNITEGYSNTPSGNKVVETSILQFISFLQNNASISVKAFFNSQGITDMDALVDLSLSILKIIGENVANYLNLSLEVTENLFSIMKEVKLLREEPGREPSDLENCERLVGRRMAMVSKFEDTTVMEEEITPFFNFQNYVLDLDQKSRSKIVHWMKYQDGIYRGERSSLVGVMFWEKLALCSCSSKTNYDWDEYDHHHHRKHRRGNRHHERNNDNNINYFENDQSKHNGYDSDELGGGSHGHGHGHGRGEGGRHPSGDESEPNDYRENDNNDNGVDFDLNMWGNTDDNEGEKVYNDENEEENNPDLIRNENGFKEGNGHGNSGNWGNEGGWNHNDGERNHGENPNYTPESSGEGEFEEPELR